MKTRKAILGGRKPSNLPVALILALSACATEPNFELSQVSDDGPPLAWTEEAWPEESAAEYALRRDVFASRDQAMFEGDLASAGRTSSQLGLSNYPAPVQPYDSYEGIKNCLAASLPHFNKFEVDDVILRVQGRTLAYSSPLVLPREGGYKVKFNLIYITDVSSLGNSTVSSRNCPHFMATGGVPTSEGAIEWLQVTMMDGRNLAVINHRVFDLEFGRTILVVPMQDGTIRFRQVQHSNDVLSLEDIDAAVSPNGIHRDFMRSLLAEPEVLAFFMQEGAVQSVMDPRLEQFLDQAQ